MSHDGDAADALLLDLIPLEEHRLDLLVAACDEHADGLVSDEPTIGACWDADRLDLPRVGIRLDPELLSTGVARARFSG